MISARLASFQFTLFWGKMTSLIKKTLFVSALTLGGILLIIFIFGSFAPLNTAVAKKAPFIRLESLPTPTPTLSQENITQEIAKQIAIEIAAQNPEGPESTEAGQRIAAINPEELAQKAFEGAFSNLKIDDLRPIVTDSELTIIKSSDTKSEEAYFNAVRRILAVNFPSTLDINKVDPSKTDFSAFDSAFNKSITELRQTPVPLTVVSFQKSTISLLGALRNVFALVKNYEKDPFQAAVAVEMGNQFGAELMQVFVDMNAYMDSHNLQFIY